MRGTHIYMTTTPAPTTTAAAVTTEPGLPERSPAATGRTLLDDLDQALVEVRRVLQRPGYRQAVLGELAGTVELATVRLLRAVQRAADPPTIGAVAEILVVDPSTASRLVDRAVDAGTLERRACDQDRRRARLHLTAAGQRLLGAVTERRRAVLADATLGWDEAALRTLLGGLAQLLEGFDRVEVAR